MKQYNARYALTPALKRVRGFHRKMDQPIGDVTDPRVTMAPMRLRLIAEEFDEILSALSGTPTGVVSAAIAGWLGTNPLITTPDMAQVSQELADLVYVALGAAVIWGVPLGEVFEEVCDANDRKVGGPVREDGKRLKPPGWTPPDIAGVLHRIATGPCRHFKTELYDCGCYNGCRPAITIESASTVRHSLRGGRVTSRDNTNEIARAAFDREVERARARLTTREAKKETMEPINFIYWLQGFLELEDPKEMSAAHVAMIKKHIALVLTPVTASGDTEAMLRRLQRDPNPKIC